MFGLRFRPENHHVETAGDAFPRRQAETAGADRQPVTDRGAALAADGGGVDDDLAQLMRLERQRNACHFRRAQQAFEVRVELVEHAADDGRGVKYGVAAMHHVIIERQHHERRIRDDAPQHAGVHGVEVVRPVMQPAAQTRHGLIAC